MHNKPGRPHINSRKWGGKYALGIEAGWPKQLARFGSREPGPAFTLFRIIFFTGRVHHGRESWPFHERCKVRQALQFIKQ